MTTLNAAELIVGADCNLYTAPLGTPEPADEVAALNAAWLLIGYTTEDGVTFRNGKTTNAWTPLQSLYPVLRTITGRSAQAAFTLAQWNTANLKLAWGGGSVAVSSGAGHTKYSPQADEQVVYGMLAIEWAWAPYHYRIIIPRGMETGDVETKLVKGDPSLLPVTFEATPSAGLLPWYLLTDDPAIV